MITKAYSFPVNGYFSPPHLIGFNKINPLKTRCVVFTNANIELIKLIGGKSKILNSVVSFIPVLVVNLAIWD